MIISIANQRFREMDIYAGIDFLDIADCEKPKKSSYASVKNVVFKDIFVHSDETVMKSTNGKCAAVKIVNCLEETEYKQITIDNVVVNGTRLQAADMYIEMQNVAETEVAIK